MIRTLFSHHGQMTGHTYKHALSMTEPEVDEEIAKENKTKKPY